jgi:hypothetical protein
MTMWAFLSVAAAFNVPAPMAQSPYAAGAVAVNGYVPAPQVALVPVAAPAQGQGVDLGFLSLGFSLGLLGTWSLRRAQLAVSGEEESTMSRRALLAGLAASPAVLAATAANAVPGAKPVWVPRKGAIEKPQSVKNGCNVEKPCAKGAVFPLSNESAKASKAIEEAALNKFKKRQPPPPPEKD